MVDALRECWRVLEPGGVLLDLRPVTSPSPIEKLGVAGPVRIGAIDGSPGAPDDRASEAAVERAVGEGLFAPVHGERFDLHCHHSNVDELVERLCRPSRRRKVLSEQDAARLRRVARSLPGTWLRTRERMQLVVHRRIGAS